MVKRHKAQWLGGCGFLLFTCLVSCGLLVFNSALVLLIYQVIAPSGPQWLTLPRVSQLIVIIGPLMMLVSQWWLYDLCVDRFTAKSDPGEARRKGN